MNSNRWRSNGISRVLFLLFLGQVVSLNLAITSFTSSFLASIGELSWWVLVSVMCCLRMRILFPCIALVLNVNQAYQFSSVTSVTLLDCWTIPWAIILTWIFIGTRYSIWQFLGAAICVVGLCLVVLSDAGVSGGGGTKPVLGDALVIAGTLCYAMSNVGEEYCVKKKDRVEVISMLGVFGLLIAAFVGYALSTFMFYSIVPFVLKMSGATLFNLSLLTSDMWAVAIRICFYHQQVDWLYYLAFGVVALGLVIYSVIERDPVMVATIGDGNINIQYQVLNEENATSRNEVSCWNRPAA
ncbi:hypothetical protein HHK36_011360 [Tetracentron sinense]|uniref:Uncharacterized protein n=1 Tax=Tetracentron sinense TaxID=13715 RepID=A0A834Z933_TETSI|nr:hypothetical protein HHK36_011360 [Tetracentron sinense]